ncbi:MacB family efflux pump subunit [Burkholderia ubonensis]|uniref:MacB family efflux pump subunit n=1 Tax=Burkholderia ubonensis TaxID=101571 RepID=UPI000755A83C|nr:MacB family efflux pump subunit [Burkholderia ubonensis]KVL13201.1 macrolide ABC transporter ATP-binding protein [Burkholderia ubonensis]KVQ49506.1 macrolide ABC transporter ATP-binding protein [Burkholderia ubonensis]
MSQPGSTRHGVGAPLISLSGVSKTYGAGPLAVGVLRDVDLDIEAGEFVAIMGPSGAGKSTLLYLLGCLDRPSRGSYRYRGCEIAQLDVETLARLRCETFGFVFQHYHLIGTASARENVELPGLYARLEPAERSRRATGLLRDLGLAGRDGHRPAQLSGGQRQRVSIARALMNGGQVILADEPTGALDSQSGAEVVATLERLSALGHTIVLVTHDPDVAAHAHRIVEMRDGAIVGDRCVQPRRAAHAPPSAGRAAAPAWTLRDLRQSASTALHSLRSNLFRSALTLLGIVIGVASVIAMMAVGDGAKRSVLERIESMGANLMIVRPGAPNQRGANVAETLTVDDAAAIAGNVRGVIAAVPEQYGNVTARRDNLDYQTTINGTTRAFAASRQWPVARGTFFDAADETHYATVAVLGETVARTLFADGRNPVGEYVLIDRVPFQVIGVMSKKGASPYGVDQDDIVLMPYTTAGMRLTGKRALSAITIAVDEPARIEDIEYAVLTLLYDRHKTVDFAVRNVAEIIATTRDAQNTLTMMLGSIAAISLLVGGIGVMNILLVTVTERTREIGVRVACGASGRHIRQQFLIEAVAVSVVGGGGGVALGLASVAVIGAFGVPVEYAIAPVWIAFACALATGVTSGLFPAWKAARLDPVVALGAE